MPAYSKAEILRSSREREKKIKNTKIILGLLLAVFMVGSFLGLLNLNFFRLTTFSILGQTSQDLPALKEAVRGELNGYCLGLVPKNSIFFFSKTRLSVLLKQKFTGLQSVVIDSPDLNTLSITVADNDAKVLWCNNLAVALDQTVGKLCFYLNADGLVYQTAPNFSDAIIMEFDKNSVIKKLPTKVINPEDLSRAETFLSFLKSEITDFGPTYRLDHINVLPFQDFEAVISSSANSNDSWRLLFNTGDSADQLITNFHSLTKDPIMSKNWPANGSTGSPQVKHLDYLDLRFANKAFYKFKN